MNHSVLKLIASANWLGVVLAIALGYQHVALSQSPTPKPKPLNSKPRSLLPNCPADVETLTTLLLRDLPSYANRVSQRTRRLGRTYDLSSTFILAGRPEFKPLTLGPGQYTPAAGASDEPRQVFFTTLERQYSDRRAVELQEFHWLFLTLTPDGWRLAMMYSRIGSYPAKDAPTPPRESSNGVIGQAVRTWLEDCRAGRIRS